jgi:site-specific recombinase XerD
MKTDALPHLLRAFFHQWMGEQRNLSPHTVLSYRDTWRLFLRFVAQRQTKAVADLTFAQLTAKEVLAFLHDSEQIRRVSIGTRNCRLAAIRAFFRFAVDQEPAAAAHGAQILRIPLKRAVKPALCYLDIEEVTAILRQPDRSTLEGQRDHTLLAFLYNTGARIQEALDLCPQAIRFKAPLQVKLLGKGRKERVCPLWPETIALITALLKRQPRAEHERLFVNRYGEPLGAAGVRFKLAGYVTSAAKMLSSLQRKKITPHTFRHTVGVHLIAAGVDVTVIRNLLGHASLDTTNHYARADLETKRKALAQVDTASRLSKPPRWKKDTELMAWLDSL